MTSFTGLGNVECSPKKRTDGCSHLDLSKGHRANSSPVHLRYVGQVNSCCGLDNAPSAVPKLVTFLEDSSKWTASVWEDLILRLLGETIKVANDDEWTSGLGEALEKQFELYSNDPEMKVLEKIPA